MTVTALGSEKSYACFFVCSVCVCVHVCIFVLVCDPVSMYTSKRVCVCTCAIVWCVCHCVCALSHSNGLPFTGTPPPPPGATQRACLWMPTHQELLPQGKPVCAPGTFESDNVRCTSETWSRVPSNKRQLYTAEGGVPLRLQAGNSDLDLSWGRKAQIRELSQVYESDYWEPRAAGSGEYQRAAE